MRQPVSQECWTYEQVNKKSVEQLGLLSAFLGEGEGNEA